MGRAFQEEGITNYKHCEHWCLRDRKKASMPECSYLCAEFRRQGWRAGKDPGCDVRVRGGFFLKGDVTS